MDRILNMIIRRVMNRVINRGVDMGIDAVTRRDGDQTSEDRDQANRTALNAKGVFRMARRIGRF